MDVLPALSGPISPKIAFIYRKETSLSAKHFAVTLDMVHFNCMNMIGDFRVLTSPYIPILM